MRETLVIYRIWGCAIRSPFEYEWRGCRAGGLLSSGIHFVTRSSSPGDGVSDVQRVCCTRSDIECDFNSARHNDNG
jgi:hypothetical protein